MFKGNKENKINIFKIQYCSLKIKYCPGMELPWWFALSSTSFYFITFNLLLYILLLCTFLLGSTFLLICFLLYFKNFPNVCYPLDLRLMKWQTHLEEKYECLLKVFVLPMCSGTLAVVDGALCTLSQLWKPCVQCKLCTLALPVKTWTNKYVSQQPQSEQEDSELRRASENLFMPDLLCKS